MYPKEKPIVAGAIAIGPDGLPYRILGVQDSITGYELTPEIGMRPKIGPKAVSLAYLVEQGIFPPGTPLLIDEAYFRDNFTQITIT